MTTTALTTTNPTAMVASPNTSSMSAARTMEVMLRKEGVSDPIPAGALAGYSRAMVDTIKASVAKDAPDEELYKLFVISAQYNLNPFLKEIWCMNIQGWQVVPSRDGYVRAARRHPNVDSVTSAVVHEGDHYEIDKLNGQVIHRVVGMKAQPGAILGAWCLVVTKDGKRYADDVYFSEVNRGIGAWKGSAGPMTEKCAQSKVLKKSVGLSDLYTADKVWETIDSGADALLVDPSQNAQYSEGFAVGLAPVQQLPATTMGADAKPPLSKSKAAWLARSTEITKANGHNSATYDRARKNFTFAEIGKASLKEVTADNGGEDEMLTLHRALDHKEDAFIAMLAAAAQKIAEEVAAKAAKAADPAIDVTVLTDDDDIPEFADPVTFADGQAVIKATGEVLAEPTGDAARDGADPKAFGDAHGALVTAMQEKFPGIKPPQLQIMTKLLACRRLQVDTLDRITTAGRAFIAAELRAGRYETIKLAEAEPA